MDWREPQNSSYSIMSLGQLRSLRLRSALGLHLGVADPHKTTDVQQREGPAPGPLPTTTQALNELLLLGGLLSNNESALCLCPTSHELSMDTGPRREQPQTAVTASCALMHLRILKPISAPWTLPWTFCLTQSSQ